MATKVKSATRKKSSSPLLERSDPLTNVLLVFPLFLIYEAGVLAIPSVHNGADLITSERLHLLNENIAADLALNAALAMGFSILCLALPRNNSLNPGPSLPLLP